MLPLGKLYISCQISHNEHDFNDVYRLALVTFLPQKFAWPHNNNNHHIIIIIIIIIVMSFVICTLRQV
jgi:hypothetical protein